MDASVSKTHVSNLSLHSSPVFKPGVCTSNPGLQDLVWFPLLSNYFSRNANVCFKTILLFIFCSDINFIIKPLFFSENVYNLFDDATGKIDF